MSEKHLVILELSWAENGLPRAETYGPWDVTDEEVHLAEIRQFMTDWRLLKGTSPDRAVMSVLTDPAEWMRKQKEASRL